MVSQDHPEGNLQGYPEIRPITLADEPFLWEMLYQALYVAEGQPPFPRDIVEHPNLRRYVEGWGQMGDLGCLAVEETTRQPVGAAWLRLLTGTNRGYGYVDDETPELTIAVLPAYRGQGRGRRLLEWLLAAAQSRYKAVCLSVSAGNPALRLYRRLGFQTVTMDGESVTMKCRLISGQQSTA